MNAYVDPATLSTDEIFNSLAALVYSKIPTFSTATLIAEYLTRENKYIHGVEVFGSVARNGKGADIDLILVVSEIHSNCFFASVRSELTRREVEAQRMLQWGTRYRRPRDFNSAYHAPNVRRTAAAEQVCLDFEDNNWEILEALDIFLFPPDWRERLDELQEALPHTDPDFMRNIARDAIPLPWKRTVPRIVHDLCPVTLEEIKIGDDLIAIDADGVSRTLGVFESGRFAFADTQEQSTYSGKYVKVDWRNTEESGNRFRLNTVYLHECGLAEWEWKDPADQSRTFRWTKEVEDYLTDIVRRNAFDEYMEIINRPKKVSATDCVSTEIPACSSGCGGTSNERAEWAQVTSAKSLMARFGDPRRKLATRLMAARSARLANEAETSGVNGDELETPIS